MKLTAGKMHTTQMGPKNSTPPAPGKPYFDYCCQSFTADDPWFRAEVLRWRDLGFCQAMPPGQIGTISAEDGFQHFPEDATEIWVGNGGMEPFIKRLINQTVNEFAGIVEHVCGWPDEGQKVVHLRKDASTSKWHLTTRCGRELGPFDVVIGGFAQHLLTDPFLLTAGPPADKMLRCLRRIESNQIIAMQVELERSEKLPMPFAAAHVLGDDALAWVSNNCSKPQQNGQIGTPGAAHLTLLSHAKFAEELYHRHAKRYKKDSERVLLASLAKVLGVQDLSHFRPRVNRINHWEDGVPMNTPPESRGCLFDADEGLGWCGDFCVAPNVQGAALSGAAMAQVVADYLHAGGSDFDRAGLLPADNVWVPICGGDTKCTIVDIGAYSQTLCLKPHITHTDLVPSAIGGYKGSFGNTKHAAQQLPEYYSQGGNTRKMGKGKGNKGKGNHRDGNHYAGSPRDGKGKGNARKGRSHRRR